MSLDTLHFEVVTPDGRVCLEQASQVVLPAANGYMGVLPKHSPVVLVLQSGVIDVHHEKKLSERIFVGGGFASINETSCIVMADDAIRVSDIKKEDVQDYIRTVRAELEESRVEEEQELLQKTLAIARAKLDLIEALRKG